MLRTLHASPSYRRERGEADAALLLVTLVVVAFVMTGISWGIVNAQRWSTVYTADAAEQSTEDASRLAWMGDVGTATAVIPAARPGTTAQQSVRFDDITREPGWPAAANCRSVTWWLEPATEPRPLPNSSGTQDVPVALVHREVSYRSAGAATGPNAGRCTPTSTLVGRAVEGTPVRNAEPGAHFTYLNGHLRELAYPNPAQPSVEACATAPKGDTAVLVSCLTAAGQPEPADQRTPWEWADPEPVQVLLEMTTGQSGSGEGYGTQIGWREATGRRELVGNPISPVTDTLRDPPAPAKPSSPPDTAVVVPNASDPAQDYLTVRRTDTRDVDGFEYRCAEYLSGALVRYLGPTDMGRTNPPTTLTVAGTRPGYRYDCTQRAWVKAVKPPQTGQRFDAGVSPWSDPSSATRRPLPVQPAAVLNANDTATFTWPATPGAEGYEVQTRQNSESSWTGQGIQPGVSWTSPVLPTDTRQFLRVRSVNAGGASPWGQVHQDHALDVPNVNALFGAPGVANYAATWAPVSGFVPGVHVYEVQVRRNGDGWPAGVDSRQAGTSFVITGVQPGHSAYIRVRVVGVNTGTTAWSNEPGLTRPVIAPPAPSISAEVIPGGGRTHVAPVACEAGVTAQYMVYDSLSGWQGVWRTSGLYHDVALDEGRTAWFTWRARCVPTYGAAADGPEAPGVSATRPYTQPGATSVWHDGNGYAGTDVRFSWSSGGAGYFRVYNAAGTVLRYSGSSTSLTVMREAGATTAQVFSFRSYEHYQAGVNAGNWWMYATASSTTSDTLVNPYPTAWSSSAPSGCPSINVYISSSSPQVPRFRRSSTSTCQVRWQVTEAGESPTRPVGTIISTGSYTLGSGASGYTQTSGDWFVGGPLWW